MGFSFGDFMKGVGQVANVAIPAAKSMGYLKKGGKVQKTGLHYVHKGEVVIPAHVVKAVEKYSKRKPARNPRAKK